MLSFSWAWLHQYNIKMCALSYFKYFFTFWMKIVLFYINNSQSFLQDMVQRFLVMVTSHPDISLRFLSFRLDFNQHYKVKEPNNRTPLNARQQRMRPVWSQSMHSAVWLLVAIDLTRSSRTAYPSFHPDPKVPSHAQDCIKHCVAVASCSMKKCPTDCALRWV